MKTKYLIKELEKHVASEALYLLKKYDCIVAGGAFTSILTNKEVNDIDVYFHTKEDFISCMEDVKSSGSWNSDDSCLGVFDLIYLGHSNKAVTFRQRYANCNIQFIHQGFYKHPLDVFADFDFTINMIAVTLKDEKKYLHKDAMQHLSQRILVTDGGAKFPIMSVLRVDKYKQRGYSISKKEMLKLILACSGLNLTSYDEVLEHVGGMYGVNLDKIFDQEKDFSIVECIEQLCKLENDHYMQFKNQCWNDFEKFVNELGEKE